MGMYQGGCGVKNQLLPCGQECDLSLYVRPGAGTYSVTGLVKGTCEPQRPNERSMC